MIDIMPSPANARAKLVQMLKDKGIVNIDEVALDIASGAVVFGWEYAIEVYMEWLNIKGCQ